jgi:sulfotransferase
VFLLAGLPRSGITVLASLLNQNNDIYTTTTSSFVELLWRSYNIWDEKDYKYSFDTEKLQRAKIPFLNKITKAYFSCLTTKPVVIDKCRSWHSIENIKLYINVYGRRPKIICPVRSIKDIVISYADLYKSNNPKWNGWEDLNWLSGNNFESSYAELKETYNSEFRDCLLLVDYEDLVTTPEKVMDKIYSFLEIPVVTHDFMGVSVAEVESDWGQAGLHKIRNKISKQKSGTVIPSNLIETFSKMNFWRAV